MTKQHNKYFLVAVCFVASLWLQPHSARAEGDAQNLVLVTLDGVRWQEVFGGVDASMIEDERYTESPEHLKEAYWHEERAGRREKLFPFIWSTVASQGVLIGDREQDSYMEVTNSWWFSYPGYNEILTGRADPAIDSNEKKWNSNVTFLEVLNNMAEFRGSVFAFGSWDVFPYIINTGRSGVPVNAGFDIEPNAMTATTRWLNKVSAQSPKLWSTVRLDFITHGYAMETLKSKHPRVTYISYGETDDFAHDDSYDRYIDAAYRTDRMLSELWNWLQSDMFYRGRTTLIITTDHGRGDTPDGWPSHASVSGAIALDIDMPAGVLGSDQIWLAAIGPGIQSAGLVSGHWKQSQVTATALSALQLDAQELMPDADKLMERVLR